MIAGNGMSRAAERLVKATWEPYRSFLGSLVTVQDQNMKLARYSTGVLLSQVEKQQEVSQAMVQESLRLYTSLLYGPTSSMRDETGTGRGRVPKEEKERTASKTHG